MMHRFPSTPARFDWYQGTARVRVEDLKACISDAHPLGEWVELERAPQGYGIAWRLEDGLGRVADVWAGGSHPHPHFVASGPSAHQVAECIRADLGNQHTVARVDPCIDYQGAGAYDLLQLACIQVARDRSIKVSTGGDHLVTMEGRTVYLGSTSSPVRLRVYDKAAELRHKFANHLDVLQDIPDHLTRLEGQIRPKSPEAKAAAAKASPVELFGSAEWMRHLMGMVAGLDLEPFQAGTVWRKSDDDRAYAAMLAQYGNLLSRRAADHGSFELLGRQIGDDLAEAARLRQRRGGGR